VKCVFNLFPRLYVHSCSGVNGFYFSSEQGKVTWPSLNGQPKRRLFDHLDVNSMLHGLLTQSQIGKWVQVWGDFQALYLTFHSTLVSPITSFVNEAGQAMSASERHAATHDASEKEVWDAKLNNLRADVFEASARKWAANFAIVAQNDKVTFYIHQERRVAM